MAHHYNSPCNQCYQFQDCKRVNERESYRKKWIEEGCPIGMSNHDCFKSPEAYKRDLENAKKSKERR